MKDFLTATLYKVAGPTVSNNKTIMYLWFSLQTNSLCFRQEKPKNATRAWFKSNSHSYFYSAFISKFTIYNEIAFYKFVSSTFCWKYIPFILEQKL
jgi:hypothetical protein